MEFKPRPYTKREFLSKFAETYKNPETNEVVAPKTSVNRLKQKPKGIKLHSVSHVVEAFNIIFK